MNYSLDQAPNSHLINNNSDFYFFGGTAYLGLQTNLEFQEFLIANIKELGSNWGASRKSNIRLSIYEEFENYISEKTGSEETLVVSSGYMAGQMLARYFSETGYEVYCAPNTHPALIHEKNKLFKDYSELDRAIKEHLSSNDSKEIVLFIDTIDFSGGNYPDFEELKKLPLNEIILVADDSHGLGIIGEDGFGIYSLLKKLKAKDLIVCGSLGKALATPCGIICGDLSRLSRLRDMDFYAGGSPPSPAALKTLIQAEALSFVQRENLKNNIEIFLQSITPDLELISMDKHPVFGYNNVDLTDYFLRNQIITTNFRYPTKTSPLVSKIVLSAHHTEADIIHLAQVINTYFK